MAPPRSYVWQFMERINMDYVQCKLCQSQYTANSGTSTMRKHLDLKHPVEAKQAESDVKRAKDALETSERSWSCVEESPSVKEGEEEADSVCDEDYSVPEENQNTILVKHLCSKRKNASIIWNFMELIAPTEVKCRLCPKDFNFDGSTSNLLRHIRYFHPSELAQVSEERGSKLLSSSKYTKSWIKGGNKEEDEVEDDTTGDEDWSILERKQSSTPLTKFNMKRKNASIIWQLVELVSPTECKCKFCLRIFNFDGYTSNLHRHFKSVHPSEFAEALKGKKSKSFPSSTGTKPQADECQTEAAVEYDIAEDEEASCDNGSMQLSYSKETQSPSGIVHSNVKMRLKRKNASLVWKIMLKMNPYEAMCQLCKKMFASKSSTSNIMRHLKRDHPQELLKVQQGGTITFPPDNPAAELNGSGNELEDFEEESLSGEEGVDTSKVWRPSHIPALRRKNKSVIWNFVKKTDDHTAICQLCGKVFSYGGGTSNIMLHLKSYHPEEFADDEKNRTAFPAVVKGEDTEPLALDKQSTEHQLNKCRKHGKFYHSKLYLLQNKTSRIIWKFFTRINIKEVRCDLCKRKFKCFGKMNIMHKHLKSAHPVPFFSAFKSEKMQNFSSTSRKMQNFSCKPRKIQNYSSQFQNVQAKAKLRETVLMTVGNLYPCSIDLLDSEGFVNFMRILDPSFVAPDKKLMKNMISDLHREHLNSLQQRIAQAPGIAVSIEIWTYRERQKYMTVTAHFLSDAWELQSRVLKTVLLESCMDLSQCIADKLERVLQDMFIFDKVKCLVGDDINLFSVAAAKLKKPYLQCMTHSLNMIINESLNNSSDFEVLVKKVKIIASFLLHNTEAAHKLSALQSESCKDKEPALFTLCGESDWLGNFKMVQCYLKLHSTLKQVLVEIHKEDILPSVHEVNVVSQFLQVLEPFAFAAEDIIADSFTCLSKFIPVVEILHQITEKLAGRDQGSDESKSAVSLFGTRLNELTGQCLIYIGNRENLLPWASTLLDPRFKQIVIQKPVIFKWVESELHGLMNLNDTFPEIVSQSLVEKELTSKSCEANNDNFNSLWSSFDESIKKFTREEPVDELQRYVEEFVISRQEDPLAWWKEREHLYPKLSNIVKQFLCIPASQLPARETFSEKEKLRKSLRNFLEEPYVDSILFLNSWQACNSRY